MRVSLRDVMAGTFSVITQVITLPMVVHVNPHAGGSGVVLGAVAVADAQPGEDLPLLRLHAVGFACVLVVPAEQVQGAVDGEGIGRAHVRTPVPTPHPDCRLLLG